jgi:hypothetical protein
MAPMPWGGEMPLVYGAAAFMLVAAVACWMLARAGWNIAFRGPGSGLRVEG